MVHDAGEPVALCVDALDSMNGACAHDAAIGVGIGASIRALYYAVFDIHLDGNARFAIEKLCLAPLGCRVHP